MNVMWSWGIEGPLSPLSPESLTEWLGYAAPLTKINYICWKIFQHFFPSLNFSTRLSFFILFSKFFVVFLARVHQCAKQGAHTVLYHGTMRLSMESANIDPRWSKKSLTGLQVKLTEYARRVFLAILLEGLLDTFKVSRSIIIYCLENVWNLWTCFKLQIFFNLQL